MIEGGLVRETKWLKFIEKEQKPKTKVYSVISKRFNCEIGEVRWYPQWRQYCFLSTIEFETVKDSGCLFSLAKFVSDLNKEHKERRLNK